MNFEFLFFTQQYYKETHMIGLLMEPYYVTTSSREQTQLRNCQFFVY